MQQTNKSYMLVDDSGEVTLEGTPEYLEKELRKFSVNPQTSKSYAILKDNNDRAKRYLHEALGDWYHMLFNNIPKDLPKPDIFRLMYLASFMEFSTGKIKSFEGSICYAQRKDLRRIFGDKLTKHAANLTIKHLYDSNILADDNHGDVIISSFIAQRGKVSIKSQYCRVFTGTLQELYNCSQPSQHSLYGQLIKLIPFTHYQTNILCEFPYKSLEECNPLNFDQITKAAEISDKTLGKLKRLVIPSRKEFIFVGINRLNDNSYTWKLNPAFTWKLTQVNPKMDELNYKATDFKVLNRIKRKPIIKEN